MSSIKTPTTTLTRKSHLIKSLFQFQSIPSISRGEIIAQPSQKLISVAFSQSQHTSEAHRFEKLFRVGEQGSQFLYGKASGTHTVQIHENSSDSRPYELKYSLSGDKEPKHISQLALFDQKHGFNYSINLPENFLGWIGAEQLRSHWVLREDGKQSLVANFEVLGAGEQKSAYFWQNEPKKDKFDYENVESWGEQMEHLRYERLFVWDLDRDEIQEDLQAPNEDEKQEDAPVTRFRDIEGIPKDLSVGQFVVSHDGNDIYFVGYPTQPRRLGMIYCEQRPSALYKLSNWKDASKSKCEKISNDFWNVISPRISPDGERLVFLTTHRVPYHKTCLQLMIMSLKDHSTHVCVDIVRRPESSTAFPGLFFGAEGFKDRIFTTDSKYVLCTVLWRSFDAVVRINLETGEVQRCLPERANSSLTMLDFDDESLLVVESNPTHPYRVLYGKYDASTFQVSQWQVIEDCRDVLSESALKTLDTLEWHHKVLTEESDGLEYEYFVVKPKEPVHQSKNELFLTNPHGGPHSVYTVSFAYTYAYLASQGFTCIVPNYRGSIGFGQDVVEALPGHCGDVDVKDCYNATQDAIATFGDKSKTPLVSVRGGSHGGFLTLWLLARYPEFYKCGIALNAVTNVATMPSSTDIPDWCYAEVLNAEYNPVPTADYLQKALAASPISMVQQIKSPTLLLVGRDDLRVPPTQSKEFYFALKAQGTQTQMIFYPENCHPIQKPKDAADVLLRTVDWLLKYGTGGEEL